MKDQDAEFSGSIPAAYDRYLGPILFQPYAEDLATRLQVEDNGSVLEFGVRDRHLDARLKESAAFGRETNRDGFE